MGKVGRERVEECARLESPGAEVRPRLRVSDLAHAEELRSWLRIELSSWAPLGRQPDGMSMNDSERERLDRDPPDRHARPERGGEPPAARRVPHRTDVAPGGLDRRRQRFDGRYGGRRARALTRSRLDPPRLDRKRRGARPRAFERPCVQRRSHGRAEASGSHHGPRRRCVVRVGVLRRAPPRVREESAARHRRRLVLRAFRRRLGAGSRDSSESARSLPHLPQGMPGAASAAGRASTAGTGLPSSGPTSAVGRRRSSPTSATSTIVRPVLETPTGSRASRRKGTARTTCGTGRPTWSCGRSTARSACVTPRPRDSRGAMPDRR